MPDGRSCTPWSGGGTAAPVIARVLHDIEAHPAKHSVKIEPRDVITETDDLYHGMPSSVPLTQVAPPAFVRRQASAISGFFSRLFR